MHNPDRLYELLPVVYRQRDAEQGYPLRELLQVIAEEVSVVEDDINQLYENWFIETCQDWVVPYIGDLIGYQAVHEAGEPDDSDSRDSSAQERSRILVPRRDVAQTIANRRRKGALALLEELAKEAAGWPARPVELYKLLGWTQNIKHPRLNRGRRIDLREGAMLELIGGLFDRGAHTVDVRRCNSICNAGRYGISSVALFVWRLRSYSVTQTPAVCLEERGAHCYSFNVLGHDTQLYNRSQPEREPTHIAEELNLPTPIRRRAFEKRIIESGQIKRTEASENYYGEGKSVTIWAPDWPKRGAAQPVPNEFVIPADLSGWHYSPKRNYLAVDPKLGRIVFPIGGTPKRGVVVSYQYAFSADMGGGEYPRSLAQAVDHALYRVGKTGDFDTIGKALAYWHDHNPKPQAAVIEIIDSGVYTEPINIALQEKESLQIRAANRKRPILRLLDYYADRPDPFTISGARGSRFKLDGLLISGRGIKVSGPEIEDEPIEAKEQGDLCDVTIRHCTLVPGWSLDCQCEPRRPGEASLELIDTAARVKIEHSILGPIEVTANRDRLEPVRIDISDSIVDATSGDREAIRGPNETLAYARLTIARTTVYGRVLTDAIELAENCIFTGLVRVARRQSGCVRFCYVPPKSRTPSRYQCQPDLVERAVTELVDRGEILPGEKLKTIAREQLRVEPTFNSRRYGSPVYGQLAATCADEIKEGADDESEMGAFHDLFQPQRAANLRARLSEYTPAGMDAGIIYAT
jgi:hypothetical protein